MLEKIKYPGLILSFAVGNAFSLGTKLALLNLPLGLAVAGIGFSAAIVGGIVHAPKTSALPARAPVRKSPLKSAVNEVRNWISFFIDTIKTPEYVVGASAAHGGYQLLFQAAMGVGLCLTAASLSPAMAAAAIAGLAVLGGVSLYSIAGGIDEQFKGVGNFYRDRFNKSAPLDPSKKNLIQKLAASPAVQKFARQSLVRKFLDSGIIKAVGKGLSPKAKKILLTCMAVETSVFSLVASTSVLMSSPAAIPFVLAASWAASSGWGLIQAARNSGVLKIPASSNRKGTAMQAAAPAAKHAKPAPSIFQKLTAPLRSVFKKSAGRNYVGRHRAPEIAAAKFQPVQP